MDTDETQFVTHYEPGARRRVKLTNGRIVDVHTGRFLDDGTNIVIEDGRIAQIGRESSGSDYEVDLKGRCVIPGLFNTHMHGPESPPAMFPGRRDKSLAKEYSEQQIERNMTECVARGITTIRHAGFVPDLRVNRARMKRFAERGTATPRVLQAVVVGPRGSYMQETLPLWMRALGMPQTDPANQHAAAVAFALDASQRQVRDAVDLAIDERGADVIKIGDEAFSLMSNRAVPTMTTDQLRAVVDQARLRGVQTMMHHSTIESFRRGLEAGVSSLAHVPYDAPLSQADLDLFSGNGCFMEPTLSVYYPAFSWNLVNTKTDNPELDRLTTFRRESYTFSRIADEFYVRDLKESVMNGYRRNEGGRPKIMGIIDMSGFFGWDSKAANTFENFALLHDHGVPMTTGNDTVAPCTPAMVDLELQMIDHVLGSDPARHPLTGSEALRMATINSARSLGLSEDLGSIETGKVADLVILDGDPLEDYRVIGTRAAAIFMDGALVMNTCGLNVVRARESTRRARTGGGPST